MTPNKNIAFDVEGTLVGYEKFFQAIDDRLGDRLRAYTITPEAFGYLWIEVSEREYTYLSVSGGYTPYDQIIEAIFWRILWKVGVPSPRDFASADDLASILRGFHSMEMRPGAAECIRILREAGFTVWAFTMADHVRIHTYFKKAGIEMEEERLISCDSSSVAKPASEAYEPLLERLSAGGSKPWFAAAHMWDVSAARRQGFRGAYCRIWEREPLYEVFGDMDVVADTLPEMAEKVVAASS